MADLDDFFAKKDKKKSKGKKFMTTEEIAKKLEETGKKSEKPKKEKPVQQPQVLGNEADELRTTITVNILTQMVSFTLCAIDILTRILLTFLKT